MEAIPSRNQTAKAIRPLWLFRRWKAAAGPLAGSFIPAAPFTALTLFGEPQVPRRNRINPATLDGIGQSLAERLAATEQGSAVAAGEAAFVIDLPGAYSLALGCYLQRRGIAPVLLWNGLHRPGSFVEGGESLPAIVRYGRQVQPWQGEGGLAFILERERTGPAQPDDLSGWRTFDNRYRVGELFPPFEALLETGLQSLIDLRAAGDELPDDLNRFYRRAARAGLSVYQVSLPLDWLTLTGGLAL